MTKAGAALMLVQEMMMGQVLMMEVMPQVQVQMMMVQAVKMMMMKAMDLVRRRKRREARTTQ